MSITKHLEGIGASGGALAAIGLTEYNALMSAIVGTLTAAWWVRVWILRKKE